jgi:hypothetical protein
MSRALFSLHAFRTKSVDVAVSGLIQMQLGSLFIHPRLFASRPSAPLATFMLMMMHWLASSVQLSAGSCFRCLVFPPGSMDGWFLTSDPKLSPSPCFEETTRYAALKNETPTSVLPGCSFALVACAFLGRKRTAREKNFGPTSLRATMQ